ncbi:hypothetical protein [Streptomyces sp. MZ04]|uniref:hypothetical protein n=1 Tax=Streptomyces sp. MZ04 TaxID=2559236 RepID=UPI00107EDAEC|nr:hypothetical protein [Streptomyces sp. MZ04]TGB16093.1 hypothetical protein E2651_01275 [Streptomyces sp. MZ04]
MGKKTKYAASYEPLGEPEPDTSEQDARDEQVARFLGEVSELAFEAGPRGLELRHVDLESSTCAFRHVPGPDPRVVVRADGGLPPEQAEAEPGGMPLPSSPPWAHLAWLVGELPFLHSFRGYGPQGGPELCGVDVPTREWAEVLVEHHGERWRVRVALEGRTEPIEFPGMVIGEMFGEGRFRQMLVQGMENVLDPGI